MKYLFIHLKDKEADKRVPVYWFPRQMPVPARAQATQPGTQSKVSHRVSGTQSATMTCSFRGCALAGCCNPDSGAWAPTQAPHLGIVGVPTGVLTTSPNTCNEIHLFW